MKVTGDERARRIGIALPVAWAGGTPVRNGPRIAAIPEPLRFWSLSFAAFPVT
ncbi:MAG: hypothetical protein LBF50_06755 [Azoarcus sp.]|nr:hypothetical protein [Azoarcus sp.]